MNKNQCILCRMEDENTNKDFHHVIPQRVKGGIMVIYMCRFCHTMIHKAERIGLCKLPSSIQEFKRWKNDFKREISSHNTGKTLTTNKTKEKE